MIGGVLPVADGLWLLGSRVASSDWRLTRGDLAETLPMPVSQEDLEEELFEDLVADVASSTMASDSRDVEFTTSDYRWRLAWDGRLRAKDAILVSRSTAPTWRPFSPVARIVRKADLEIVVTRRIRVAICSAFQTRSAHDCRARFRGQTFRNRGHLPCTESSAVATASSSCIRSSPATPMDRDRGA